MPKNRIFSSPSPERSESFGLITWLKQTRVPLPLKGVECRFQVCGELLSVELDQIFEQNAGKAVDCLYSFPLPVGAAVSRCEMHVNGRLIRAKVEEQAEARRLVQAQKAAGRRTALVEMERENLFTLSLGNVQPGDLVVIRFAYFATLARLADWVTLRIPFCPGVRYIPGRPLLRALRGAGVEDDTDQVPDASRISPPRIDQLHPDAAYLAVQGSLDSPAARLGDVSSASHPVLVRANPDGTTTVTLADDGAVPDGDFSLRWSERPGERQSAEAWMVKAGKDVYALVTLWGTGECETRPEALVGTDFYFLVDRSGSMAGMKWGKAVEAFRAFLKHCGTNDRAWVTFFNDNWQDFAERPFTLEEWAAEPGLANLTKIGTGGGTELFPALQHALEVRGRFSENRRASLVLITDGQVGNEAQILRSLRAHPNLSVHVFGIDTAVNDALLTRLAEQQRGSCCLLQPTDDIVGAVARIATRLGAPVLSELKVEGQWELAERIPDVHRDECVCVALRRRTGDAGASDTDAHPVEPVVVRGRLREGREGIFQFQLRESSQAAIRLLWAGKKIRSCLARGNKAGALGLAKQYNLICDGAAFVAWDEAEKVSVAMTQIYQPSLRQRAAVARHSLYSTGNIIPCLENIVDEERVFERSLDEGGTVRDCLFTPAMSELLTRHPEIDVTELYKNFGKDLIQWRTQWLRRFPNIPEMEAFVELMVEWMLDGANDQTLDVQGRFLHLLRLREALDACNCAEALGVVRGFIEAVSRIEDDLRARMLNALTPMEVVAAST